MSLDFNFFVEISVIVLILSLFIFITNIIGRAMINYIDHRSTKKIQENYSRNLFYFNSRRFH